MKTQRFLLALTVVNLGLLLVLLLWQIRPLADSEAPVLRGRALEIVDERGRVRASISVLPAIRQAGGDTYAETVLLRLITEQVPVCKTVCVTCVDECGRCHTRRAPDNGHAQSHRHGSLHLHDFLDLGTGDGRQINHNVL